MKKPFKFLGLSALLSVLAFSVYSCEHDDNPVGANILAQVGTMNEKLLIDVTAENIAPEAIRSDKARIEMALGTTGGDRPVTVYSDKATIGVYDEPIFGKTQSSFYSQIRLNELNPSFGENAKVDSVVLSLPSVSFQKDTLQKSEKLIETLYSIDKKDPCKHDRVTNIYEKSYKMKIDSLYGNTSDKMNLQVYQVTENMGTIKEPLLSNKSFNIGDLLGEKEISNTASIRAIVSAVKEGSEKETKKVISIEKTPNYHISLPKLAQLFQEKVIDNSSFTGDQITFIHNVLQGIKITTNSSNGFIFTFAPSRAKLTMYYSFDNPEFKDKNNNGIDDSEENCSTYAIKNRKTGSYAFLLGESVNPFISGYNVFQNEIQNTGAKMASSSEKLYLSGMGGNTVVLNFNKEQIQKLKSDIKAHHWAITEASLKVYVDKTSQGVLPIPQYLHVYNATDKKLIEDYLGAQTSGREGLFFNRISEPYNNGFYKLRITDFIKNIVEKDQPLASLKLVMGNYIKVNRGDAFYTPPAYDFSNNIYNPYRLVVFSGSNKSPEDKKLVLEIQYTKQ